MNDQHKAVIKAIANLLRSLNLDSNKYYEYRIVALPSSDEVCFFQESLVPIAEKEVWSKNPEDDIEMRKKCRLSLVGGNKHAAAV